MTFQRISIGLVAALMALTCQSRLVAQNDGGGFDTPGTGVPTTPVQQVPQGPTQESNFNTGGGGVDFGSLIDQLTIPEIPEFENQRNTRFVGRSLEAFEELGILAHPRSNADPAGSISGGSSGANRGVSFGGAGNQRNQGLQGGATNNIVRKSLRTRVVPRIEVRTPISTQQISSRFQQRISRIPRVADSATGVQVRVEGDTAFLTGTVGSIEQRNQIERMARLEPGIYRINNQLQVQQ